MALFYPFPREASLPMMIPPSRAARPPSRAAASQARPHTLDSPAQAAPDQRDGDEAAVALSDEMIGRFARMERRRQPRGARQHAAGARARVPPASRLIAEREAAACRASEEERRKHALRRERLYGPHLRDVREHEARLNAAFDAISHADQPAVWPSVALRRE
ncbi:hypothetical protein AB1Y20_002650 [Prymnesium parvum]|uniref:Uncharacterized protein n=1 Tax=Prymnesium parvum TaxID=97485 RepID=A0AB34J959_PRYPA